MRLGRVYEAEHVNVMAAMIARNLKSQHRIICVTDNPEGIGVETFELWDDHSKLNNATKSYLPSCYRRLKLYDQKTQRRLGINVGDRIVGIDLDTIVTGGLDDLFLTMGDYVGWEMIGGRKGRVFNGSLQMFNSDGALQFIWDEFKGNESRIEAANNGYHGSDQAWLSYKLVGRDGSVGLRHPAITSYPLQARIQNRVTPKSALCFFHGLFKPWDPEVKQQTPWVLDYWRM